MDDKTNHIAKGGINHLEKVAPDILPDFVPPCDDGLGLKVSQIQQLDPTLGGYLKLATLFDAKYEAAKGGDDPLGGAVTMQQESFGVRETLNRLLSLYEQLGCTLKKGGVQFSPETEGHLEGMATQFEALARKHSWTPPGPPGGTQR